MENDPNSLSAKMSVVNNLHSILMRSPSVIMIFKGKDHLLWLVNTTAFDLLRRGAEILDKPVLEAVPELKGLGIIESLDYVFKTGNTCIARAVPIRLFPQEDAETHYFDITYQPYLEYGNRLPAGIFAIAHDVTGLVEAKSKVAEVEERLHSALDAAEMGTWDYDLLTNTMVASDGFKRLFGLSPGDEFTFESFINSVIEEDRAHTLEVNQDVMHLKNGQSGYDLQYRIKRPNDGALRWIRARGKVYANQEGRPYRFIGMLLDVTKEKKAEERSRYIFETVPLSIWETDYTELLLTLDKLKQQYGQRLKDYLLGNKEEVWHLISLVKLNDVNRASLRMFEADTKEQLLEGGLTSVFTDESIPVFIDQLIALSFRDASFHAIFPLTTLQGKKIICSTTIDYPKDGSYNGVIVSRYNISELVRMNEELQQFVHMISHDLKEPIRKIIMYASRLEKRLNDLLDEESKIYFRRIQTGASRMCSMADGMRDYSQLNVLEKLYEPVDLNMVMKKIEIDLESIIEQKSATIRYSNLPQVKAITLLIYRVFCNLISNSLKFCREGQVPNIVITSEAINKNGQPFARILFQDNGIGFEQQYAEQIFKAFTRLHAKDRYEGAGMGLFLCKKIIERHGGSITATSEEHKGTAFEVLLPMAT